MRRALEIGFQDLETGRQDLETGHPGFGNWESWIWKLASLDLEIGGLQDLETGRHDSWKLSLQANKNTHTHIKTIR